MIHQEQTEYKKCLQTAYIEQTQLASYNQSNMADNNTHRKDNCENYETKQIRKYRD